MAEDLEQRAARGDAISLADAAKWIRDRGKAAGVEVPGDEYQVVKEYGRAHPDKKWKIEVPEDVLRKARSNTITGGAADPAKKAVESLKGTTGPQRNPLTEPLLGGLKPSIEGAEKYVAGKIPSTESLAGPGKAFGGVGEVGKFMTGMAGGMAKSGIDMTSASNLTLMILTGGFSQLPKYIRDYPKAVKLVNAMRRMAAGGFSALSVSAAVNEYPELETAIKSGDMRAAGDAWGEMLGDIVFAKWGAEEALKGTAKGKIGREETARHKAEEKAAAKKRAVPPGVDPTKSPDKGGVPVWYGQDKTPAQALRSDAWELSKLQEYNRNNPKPLDDPEAIRIDRRIQELLDKLGGTSKARVGIKPKEPGPVAPLPQTALTVLPKPGAIAPQPPEVRAPGQPQPSAPERVFEMPGQMATPIEPPSGPRGLLPPSAGPDIPENIIQIATKHSVRPTELAQLAGQPPEVIEKQILDLLKAHNELKAGGSLKRGEKGKSAPPPANAEARKQLANRINAYLEILRAKQPAPPETAAPAKAAKAKPAAAEKPPKPPVAPKKSAQAPKPAPTETTTAPAAAQKSAAAVSGVAPTKLELATRYLVAKPNEHFPGSQGMEIVYQGREKKGGRHNFKVIDPETGQSSSMYVDGSVSEKELLKGLEVAKSPTPPGGGGKKKVGSPVNEAKARLKGRLSEFGKSEKGEQQFLFDTESFKDAYVVAKDLAQKMGDNFERWRQNMIYELGEAIRPRLQEIWDAIKPAPVWYSQLERTIADKMPNQATTDQVRGIINNPQSGVKPDEIKWTGLDDYLAMRKGKVSKSEIQTWLKNNALRVNETTLGEKLNPREVKRLDELQRGDEWNPEGEKEHEALYNIMQPPEYARYQLPGGKNYRELLFWKPAEPITEKVYHVKFAHSQADPAMPGYSTPKESQVRGSEEYVKSYMERFKHLEPQLVRVTDEPTGKFKTPIYTSGHWSGQPNVLAHTRFNDRVDAQGRKTLFMEELQSDWHQQGRDFGYAGPETKEHIKNLREELRSVQRQLSEMSDRAPIPNYHNWQYRFLRAPGHQASSEEIAQYNALLDKNEAIITSINQLEAAVPDAPFSKTWHEMVLRRMLRWAAEKGYDQLAWTTGEQQAERYNQLLRNVRKLRWNPHTGILTAFHDADGEPLGTTIGQQIGTFKAEKLPDIVGKEMAQRLVDPANKTPLGFHQISGEDITIGGHGMKGFYDKILPEYLNKYGKKWGARVEETEIEAEAKALGGYRQIGGYLVPEGWGADDIRHLQVRPIGNSWVIYNREFVSYAADNTGKLLMFDNKHSAEASMLRIIDDLRNPPEKPKTKVHSIQITPEMKRSVLKEGQPIAKVQPPPMTRAEMGQPATA